MSQSILERDFIRLLELEGLPQPECEYRFHPSRMWRFDFAWPDLKFAVEIEGGIYSGGRHTRGAGFEKDAEKYNHAAIAGWRVLRFGPNAIASGQALALTKMVLLPDEQPVTYNITDKGRKEVLRGC